MSLADILRPGAGIRRLAIASHGPPPVPEPVVREREAAARERAREEATRTYEAQMVELRQEARDLADGLFQRLTRELAGLQDDLRSALPYLVLQAVRRVLAGVEFDGQIVAAVVKEVLHDNHLDGEPVVVQLHPEDLEALHRIQPSPFKEDQLLRFEAGEGLKRGDCVLRSRFGRVDSRIETKLRHLEQSLLHR